MPEQRLRTGTSILAVGALGLAAASFAILAQRPDVSTVTGRLLCSGALANLSLSGLWAVIALVPLRRGEPWAFWAWFLPIPMYGLPMLFLEMTNVPRRELVSTLAPQVSGLLVGLVGLLWVAPAVFGASSARSQHGDDVRGASASARIARWVLLGVGGIFVVNGVVVTVLNQSGVIPPHYWWPGAAFLVLGASGVAVAWLALRPGRIWPVLALAVLYVPWTMIGILGDTRAGLWALVAGEVIGLGAVAWAIARWVRDAC